MNTAGKFTTNRSIFAVRRKIIWVCEPGQTHRGGKTGLVLYFVQNKDLKILFLYTALQAGVNGRTGVSATTRVCSIAAGAVGRSRRLRPASARETSLSPGHVSRMRYQVRRYFYQYTALERCQISAETQSMWPVFLPLTLSVFSDFTRAGEPELWK